MFKVNDSFITFFNLNSEISYLKRFYIKSGYTFLRYSKLKSFKEDKIVLKSIFLIFNFKNRSIDMLVQVRLPLIIIIILSYVSVCLLKLTF